MRRTSGCVYRKPHSATISRRIPRTRLPLCVPKISSAEDFGFHGANSLFTPEGAVQIPCSSKIIPCSVEQVIRIGSPVTTTLFTASGAPKAPIMQNSLFFSLLAGNFGQETGSTLTASATKCLHYINNIAKASKFSGICDFIADPMRTPREGIR
jgi:hypothetical protein